MCSCSRTDTVLERCGPPCWSPSWRRFIATSVGTAAAIGFSSMKRRSRNLFLTVNNIPLTNADIITGVSMMLLFVFAGQVLADFSGWLNSLAGR